AIVSSFLGAPAPDDTLRDREAMQGRWEAVRLVRDGRDLLGQQYRSCIMRVEKDEISISFLFSRARYDGGVFIPGAALMATFQLMGIGRPKAIELRNCVSPKDCEPSHGIYRLNGDELLICINRTGKERPTAFRSDGPGSTLYVFKRERKE